jgi:hypothetical protein
MAGGILTTAITTAALARRQHWRRKRKDHAQYETDCPEHNRSPYVTCRHI